MCVSNNTVGDNKALSEYPVPQQQFKFSEQLTPERTEYRVNHHLVAQGLQPHARFSCECNPRTVIDLIKKFASHLPDQQQRLQYEGRLILVLFDQLKRSCANTDHAHFNIIAELKTAKLNVARVHELSFN